MSVFERLYAIDAAIRAPSYPSVERLTEQFSVSRRAILADIRFLRDRLRAPIRFNRVRGGYEYTDRTFVIPRVLLTERDVRTIRRAVAAARAYGGVVDDAETLQAVMERVGDLLAVGQSGVSVVPAYRLAAELQAAPALFDDCQHAIARRCRMELRYAGVHRGEVTERTVRPIHLFQRAGEWYLVAHCELRSELRDFHLGRVLGWRRLEPEGTFTRPVEFDPEAYVRQALGVRHGEPAVTVRVRFTPHQSRWVRERVYHPSQTLDALPDGGVALTMTVAGTFEAKRWVLGFGAEAEVLEPESLRREMAVEVEALRKIYGASPE